MSDGWVFGYGSLVHRAGDRMDLPGFRRRWNVAMDNRVAIAGYKRYLDPQTGQPPPVVVTFLNLVEDGAGTVNGVVFRADLDVLDRRERQYVRREVQPGLWTYVGRPEAVARYEAGPAVVQAEYHDEVRAGFAHRGELERFDESTDPPAVPLVSLRRIELP